MRVPELLDKGRRGRLVIALQERADGANDSIGFLQHGFWNVEDISMLPLHLGVPGRIGCCWLWGAR